MAKGPVRRAHLIGQSGVGGLTVLPGGISVITGVLDDWFAEADDTSEFEIDDWRLEQRLHVDHFRLAPDYRRPRKDVPNLDLSVPGYRFPKWHTCPMCHRLVERSNPFEQNRLKCQDCETAQGRAPFLDQVLIVACCENGHIQDFPWREWVHSSVSPPCSGKLKLESKTGVGLTAFNVSCEGCNALRPLDDVLNRDALTRLVDSAAPGGYPCKGFRVWEGAEANHEPCGLPLTGIVRNASNIYFPRVYSSLHLPLADTRPVERIVELLSIPPLNELLNEAPNITAKTLQMSALTLREFSVDDISMALNIRRSSNAPEDQLPRGSDAGEKSELHYREEEHRELSQNQSSEFLTVRHVSTDSYGHTFNTSFKSVALIPTLRETRVQAGFSRIVDGGLASNPQRMLWRSFPTDSKQRWLPAYRVYGEGILLQLNESAVADWERRPGVSARIHTLGKDLSMPVHCIGTTVQVTSPHLARLFLIHSFAHALMREFVVTCGYSAAALRERLYVSKSKDDPMASVLVYTASGDSAGSMGGLVRLGEPEHLEPLVRRCLQRALWCATDPVCFEAVPETTTSTRELANLAACHNCMFVPETSCEEFNGLLDRALLVGTDDEPSLGFFADLVR